MENASLDSRLDRNEEPIQHQERGEDEEATEEATEDEVKANYKQTLFKRIKNVKGAGSFAFSKPLASCPIPGICVDGKPIAIPLSEEAAQYLISKSEKAPYGNHKETLVDDTGRDTYEISKKRISFRNKQWGRHVDEIVQSVAHELGENGSNVRAKFYKHLLYKPGAMFKPHKDTEKDPSMFGTLVICLPSEHTGGTVCLQHGGKSLKLSTAETSAYGYSYLAWYADVTHEIEPVQTGYRWVLTYNLIRVNTDNESSRTSAMVLDSQILGLRNALSSWETQQDPPDFLVYVLDHQYTQRNLRLSFLEGRDYQRAGCLAEACKQHGKFYLFLAQLSTRDSWENDHEEYRDVTQQRYLHHVCSLEGFELSPLKVEIDETWLLNSFSYQQRNLDSRLGGGYLGNRCAEFVETYSDMVLVMVRAASLHAPLFDPTFPLNVDKVMGHLWAGINDNTKTMLQEILACLCHEILDQKFAKDAMNDAYLGYAAATAAFLGDWPLFKKAQNKTQEISRWNHNTWSTLGGLIDLQNLLAEVDDLFEPLKKHCTLRDAYNCLTYFYNGIEDSIGRIDTTKAVYWKQWYSNQLIEKLNLCNDFEHGVDVVTIQKIILGVEVQHALEQREKMDEAVAKLVNRLTVAYTWRAQKLLNELNAMLLTGLSNPKNARKEFLCSLFGCILELAVSQLNLQQYCRVGVDTLREFYKRTLAHNKGLATKLLQQILDQLSQITQFSVLGVLRSLLEELSLADSPSLEVQTWLETFVETYITKAAGKEPEKPENWARLAELCNSCDPGCKVCVTLNFFIRDVRAEDKTIALTDDDQNHAKRNFPYLKTENGGRLNEVRFIKTFEQWKARNLLWESHVEAAKRKLRELPKLKQVLGDKYNGLIGGTAQAVDEAQLPLKRKGEDAIDAGKRVRLSGKDNED
ncbi:hypothetical protein ACQKWADRAFT_82283 [Trichoderma austrokoningii]